MSEQPTLRGQDVVINDYLYIDRQRLAAYHAQLLGSGTPLVSKFTQSYQESEKNAQQFGLPKIFSFETAGEDLGKYGSERTFDQSWPMLLQAIEELDARGYVHSGALAVPVGSIVRLQGKIQIVDLSVLANLWQPLFKLWRQQQSTVKGQSAKGQAKAPDAASLISDIAKSMPQPLVVHLITSAKPEEQPWEVGPESITAWGVMQKDGLVGTSESFALMNGGLVPGDYEMVAVLDVGAVAEAPPIDFSQINPSNTFEFALMMQQMVRQTFGRPNYANGVTPLTICRKLKPDSEPGHVEGGQSRR